MKTIKYSFILIFTVSILIACDVDYEDNPNEPQLPSTPALFNDATKRLIDGTRDEWFEGRFTLPTMQYWAQVNYTEEDRYQYRPNLPDEWENIYQALENYRSIIYFNTDEKFKASMQLQFGPNEGQIAIARIMICYGFNLMADTFGDIPYYSFGNKNPDFQALQAKTILKPKYAKQRDIYLDILNELKAAASQLEKISGKAISKDPIYNGDAKKWRKFANSLRLRIGIKLLSTSEKVAAQKHINEAKNNAFTSNEDNAQLTYETNDLNAAPFYRAYNVDRRKDFAISYPFVTLLEGKDLTTTQPKENPFKGIEDPRLSVFAAPNRLGNLVGMPYGIASDDAPTFKWESLPGNEVLKPDFSVVLMDYAETEFILSELDSWNEEHYKKGVEASLLHWGISKADAKIFVDKLPSATEEKVLTQKYIALYMQSHVAWTEYRRTGYPKFLIMPNEKYTVTVQVKKGEAPKTFDYEFIPLVEVTDLPTRVNYPPEEININGKNLKEAISRLQGGDEITSKLWWDIN